MQAQLAWTFAGAGAGLELSALGAYFGVLHRKEELRASEPTRPGFLSLADQYGRLRSSVMPLALTGGVL